MPQNKRRSWTPADDETVRKLRDAGRTIYECAESVGRTYQAVQIRLARLGASRSQGRPNNTPLTPAQADLAAAHVDLIRLILPQFARRWPTHRDDLESAAYYGLVKAARGFIPGKRSFHNYANDVIRNTLIDHVRHTITRSRVRMPEGRSVPKFVPLPDYL